MVVTGKKYIKGVMLTLFAAYIDYVYLKAIIFMVISVLSNIVGRNLIYDLSRVSRLIIVVLPIIITGVYYIELHEKIKMLSFGEYLTGRVLIDQKKMWINVYERNRFGIFLVIFMNMIDIGHRGSRMSQGHLYTYVQLVTLVLMMVVITYLLKEVIRGELVGLLTLAGLSLFALANAVLLLPSSMQKLVVLATYTIYIITSLAVYFVYKDKINKVAAGRYY